MRNILLKIGFAAAFVTILSVPLTAVGQRQILLEAKLLSADISNRATFGVDVAIDGDTAVIGAPMEKIGRNNHQGAAYVFVKREGAWINQAKLVAADGYRGQEFGRDVAISGNTIVVGVPLTDIGGDKDQGAVYVFERSGDNWEKQVKLTANGGRAANALGMSVGISGDTIIAGAPGVDNKPDDNVPQAHGAAYIFTRENENWAEKQKLTEGGEMKGSFGQHVAIDNKTAVVTSATSALHPDYVHVFSDDGTGWKQEERVPVKGSVGDKQLSFGVLGNIAIDKNTFIIGGVFSGPEPANAVHVFVRDGGKWTEQAQLVEPERTGNGFFGRKADINGDMIVIGSSWAAEKKGAVFVYGRALTGDKWVWTLQQQLNAADSKLFDQFGAGVAVSGRNILIGASNHDLKKRRNGNEGVAYIFSSDGVDAKAPPSATKIATSHVGGRDIPLKLNAKKNGYTITREGDKLFFHGIGVVNPLTNKLLEGSHTLSYGCETPANVQSRVVAWSSGRRARLGVACAIIYEPKVLLLDEPTGN